MTSNNSPAKNHPDRCAKLPPPVMLRQFFRSNGRGVKAQSASVPLGQLTGRAATPSPQEVPWHHQRDGTKIEEVNGVTKISER